MPITLKAPGIGDYQPSFRDTPLFQNYGNLQRSLQAPYYDEFVNKASGSASLGSVRGGPTLAQALDLQAPDPRRWSTIAPPKAVASPILGSNPQQGNKLGSFSLDLIHPFESLHDATTRNIGIPEQGEFQDSTFFGSDGPRVFGVKPIDVLNWQAELPVKLMERPLALAQVLVQRLTGGGAIQADPDGNAAYPFQKDPAYWRWLAVATDTELEQQARAVAGSYLSYGRNQALVETLMDRFKADRGVATGMSSGIDTIDYTAKKRLQQGLNLYHTWQRLNAQPPSSHWDPAAQGWDPTQGQGGYVPGPGPDWRPVADPGFQSWLSSDFGKDYIAALTLDRPGTGDDVLGGLLNALPLFGTKAAQFLAGPSEEAAREWESMPLEVRQQYLADAGFTTIVNGIATALPLFGGLGALGMAAKASSIPSVAAMGRAWALSLRAANVSMALGIGVTTAAWAGESFAPYADQREFFRDVNLADPVGHSTLGGVLNTVGMFASGTFGAALAIKGTARAIGAIDRGTAGLGGRLIGSREIPYYTDVFGGSETTDALFRHAGVEATSSELAFARSLLSLTVHGAIREGEATYRRAAAGETIGIPAVDAMEPVARLEWAEQQLARTYAATPALIAQMVERIGRARAKDPLVPTHEEAIAYRTNRAAIANLIDTATREHVGQYGPDFFGADVGAIRARVQAALTDMGYSPDMAGLDNVYGTGKNVRTLQRWLQLARAVHQLEYSVRDAQLFEHLKTADEPGATLFSQRTLSVQDIVEALPILRGSDLPAAQRKAAELINGKARVGEAYALGKFRNPDAVVDPQTASPVDLASYLEAILKQNGAPRFRDLPSEDAPTVDLPLNAFHRRLVEEGKWQIGFRAREWMPSEESFAAALERELSPAEMLVLEPERFTLRDVAPGQTPAGYIELTAGMGFRRKNWYALDPIFTSDGRFFVKDDGTLNLEAAETSVGDRPSNNPTQPYPVDANDPVSWDTLTEKQKALARSFDQPRSSVSGGLSSLYFGDLTATGESLLGRNAGAEWPVLEHRVTGDRYLFKARRAEASLDDLSEARRLAGPAATRLLTYLGLHVAEERPFEWQGTKGTIQKLVDVAEKVDLNRLDGYPEEIHNELVKQHIGDWLTGQFDSNSDSMLLGNDGFVHGVDKGQAYKYADVENEAHELLTNFWLFRTKDAADLHLGEYLYAALDRGEMILDRQAVEPLLRAIEDLPEDVYLASLQELAAARVADGRFETSPGEFFDYAIARKRNIRLAVNVAFRDMGYAGIEKPGSLPHWDPGMKGQIDLGTPTWLNARPAPIEEVIAYNETRSIDEPELPPTAEHYKAGVVIQEPDGRVWLINPKDGFGGYAFTWPKGRHDMHEGGEPLWATAVREAYEETGLAVRLQEHLADLPNEDGNITRYYLAERLAGGPEFVGTPDEIGSIVLVDAAAAGEYLHRNGAPDPRDNAVVDALMKRKSDKGATTDVEGLDAAEPTETMAPDPAGEMGYTSHVRLPNGAVWRTSWLDANVREASQIELGNRGIAGRAFDKTFQGWRAWRILETQKAGMHFRLARDYEMGPGMAEKVELLYARLLRIRDKTKGGTIQAIAAVDQNMPWVGHYAEEVAAAAKEIFGEGPYLSKRTGRPEVIDFNRLIAKSFQQSIRMNFTAGITSYLKSVPGLGQIILPITDFAYPLLRFHISPLFKGGEYVESSMLNAMRGVQRSGDPFIDALWWKAGAGSGLGVLMEEAGADMMLANLSSLAPVGSARGRHADAAFFFEHINAAEHAKAAAGQIAPSDPFTPGRQKGLEDGLTGHLEIPDPVKFPDRYSELTPRRLLRELDVDDATGEPILDLQGGERSRDQVARYRNELLGEIAGRLLGDPSKAEGYGAGMAFIASLPPGTLERLAEALPLVHTPVSKNGTAAQIGFVRQAILGDYPAFSGRLSTGDFMLKLSGTPEGVAMTAQQTNFGKASTTISEREQWIGFADAKYGSVAAEYQAGNHGGLLVVLKPEKLRDSVTTNTDRIYLENDVVSLQDAMMTPATVQAITRLQIQRAILDWHVENPELSLREFLDERLGRYFTGTSPFEMAYMNGIALEDIAAVMLPHESTGEWSDLVSTYKDHPSAKGLDAIDVVPYDDSFAQGNMRTAMVGHWLDRAGLAELGGLKPEIFSTDEAIMALPVASVTPANIHSMKDQVAAAAGRLGLSVKTELSHLDKVTLYRNGRARQLHGLEREASKKATSPTIFSSSSAQQLREAREQITAERGIDAMLTDLQADLREFYETGRFSGRAEANAAAAGDNAALADLAEQWIIAEEALKQRMIVLGVKPGSGERLGTVRVTDKAGEVLSHEEFDEQPVTSQMVPVHDPQSYLRPEDSQPFDIIETQALLAAYHARVPQGYSTAKPGVIPEQSLRPIMASIDTPALRSAVRARAEAKLGHDLSDPVIRAYVRGHGSRMIEQYGALDPGVDELVVTIAGGDGLPYGNLTLGELQELWVQYGLPADFRTKAEASGYVPGGALSAPGEYAGDLMLGPGPRPEGRAYYYRAHDVPMGQFEQTPTGRDWIDPKAKTAFDVQLAYSFDPAGQSYIDLATGTAFHRPSVTVHEGSWRNPNGTITNRDPRVTSVEYARSGEPASWSYKITKVEGFRDVDLVHYKHQGDIVTALRDVFDRTRGEGAVRVKLTTTDAVAAYERLYVKGEVPDHIVAVDHVGDVLDAFRIVRDMSTDTLAGMLPEPPAADFAEVTGTPESMLERTVEAFRGMGAQGKRAADALMNPVPYKQVQMDRLTFHLARKTFAPMLKAENPRAAAVFAELKVPEHRWADFLLEDRHLLSRFRETGSRGDWEALVQHAARHTGKADYLATQKNLDELYMSADFEVMLETWRATVKAAQDESYAVHFFSPYRSTFERSINHPVFGIYPASWSFKIAKEWFRFLYQNETLGFRVGMTPAVLIRQVTDAQARLFAQQNPTDLEQFWEKGPLRSSAFIFNLLLPGDWSSVPFPFSRTIRDIARGQADPVELFVNNMTSMGIGRDIRLGTEAVGEISNLVSGSAGQGAKWRGAWSATDVEGLPQGAGDASYARAESVRNAFAYR